MNLSILRRVKIALTQPLIRSGRESGTLGGDVGKGRLSGGSCEKRELNSTHTHRYLVKTKEKKNLLEIRGVAWTEAIVIEKLKHSQNKRSSRGDSKGHYFHWSGRIKEGASSL